MNLPPMLGFTTRTAYLRKQFQTLGRPAFEEQLMTMAAKIGPDRFRSGAADDLISTTRPAELLPDVYSAYRPVVIDGIRFMLSRLSLSRVVGLVADQAELAPDAPTAHRLTRLARRLPTFHKLGQIIARNRHLDPSFKTWLVGLETGPATTAMEDIEAMVRDALGGDRASRGVTMGPAPLAEASVGVVIAFDYAPPHGGRVRHGVLKTLKPGVRDHLTEELGLLDDLARHFEARRGRYALDRFRFIETFAEVRRILMEEIDLPGEQRNLARAAAFYKRRGGATVPGLLPISTDTLTAMDFVAGEKITDAPADPDERCGRARTLFRSLILAPLFSTLEAPPFHGDPHAGNLLASSGNGASGRARIGLVDWSLSGTLHRRQRRRLMALMRGVAADDAAAMERAVRAMAAESDEKGRGEDAAIEPSIREITARSDYRCGSICARTFALIDGLVLAGIPFPADLMLFRKAFFTLDGVIADLDPDFDMDGVMMSEMARLLAAEMPQRWLALLFPFADRAENYRTLTSNADLRRLMGRLLLDLCRKGARLTSGMAIGGLRTVFPFAASR